MADIIGLFIFLMTREKTTSKEIAERFGWTQRTAIRKVGKLSLAIPIVTVQGRRGGVFIMPEYKKEFIKRIS